MPEGDRYAWDAESTYVKRPPYFEGMPAEAPDGLRARSRARGCSPCSATASPPTTSRRRARSRRTRPAGAYLIEHGVEPRDFNSYGSRRGNHEVMMRGTFANVRLRNLLAPGTEGGFTVRRTASDDDLRRRDGVRRRGRAAVRPRGKEYGSGSSRDWAAKGPRLLGVRFVIAESYERIHRSNLVGMGVLPLQFPDGESVESLGLTGDETLRPRAARGGRPRAPREGDAADGASRSSSRRACGSTRPNEWQYYRHGGILHFVLRDLLARG